jgi:DME family drug/metabolite transporter
MSFPSLSDPSSSSGPSLSTTVEPSPTTSVHLRGVLSLTAAAIAWGTGGAVAVLLQRHNGLGPVTVAFGRFAVAVVVSAFVRRRSLPGASGGRRSSDAVIAGLGLAISQASYFASVDDAGVAVGTLVTMGAGPVLIAVSARYVLGERLTRGRIGTIGLALIGLVLLSAGPHGNGRHPVAGVLLALLSAATYAVVVLNGRARPGHGQMLPAYVVGMVVLAPFAAIQGLVPQHGRPIEALAGLVYLGVVPTVLAYRWFYRALVTVPAATASVIALLESVTAAVIGVAVLGERLSPAALAGTAVLLAAVGLMARTGRRPPSARRAATVPDPTAP